MPEESGISVRLATNEDAGQIRELVFGILAEYNLKPDPEGIDADLYDIESSYFGNGGVFEVLVDGAGSIIGSVGLFRIDEKTVELRKMYLDKAFRGAGLGKITLKRMIATATGLGYKKMVLETASPLVEAIGLYKSFGFRPAEAAHAPRCDRAFFYDLTLDAIQQ